MMEKIVLKAQNEEELKNMVSRSLTLKEDETYRVKVLKYPKKILFISIKGEYEIEIIKKSELKTDEIKTEGEKPKAQNEYRNAKKDKREARGENRNNFQKDNGKKNYRNENEEKSAANQPDLNIDKIRAFFKEFIVSVKLDVRIVSIKKENNNKYLVILDGKDMRFLIGEKGIH